VDEIKDQHIDSGIATPQSNPTRCRPLSDARTEHNGAAFLAYPASQNLHGGTDMRFILGVIVGCALTVGVAYVADRSATGSPTARPMVNWDVVAKNVDGLTELAREGWKKIAG